MRTSSNYALRLPTSLKRAVAKVVFWTKWQRVLTQSKISLRWLRKESNDIAAYIRFFA